MDWHRHAELADRAYDLTAKVIENKRAKRPSSVPVVALEMLTRRPGCGGSEWVAFSLHALSEINRSLTI
ncbi:MAG: hypothetical protein WBE50_10140 [Methyloceanibacter sp.]